jgi:stearoyl-CoA desaturase (delta-9 desaturase)
LIGLSYEQYWFVRGGDEEAPAMNEAPAPSAPATPASSVSYVRLGAFAVFHLLGVAAIWTGISRAALALCFGVYAFQVLAVTVGYHRYFSHRSFKTGRVMQVFLAFCAQTSFQKGVLWWAAHHRYHHRHSDKDDDLHSPRHGLWWSYAGWIFDDAATKTDVEQVKDLARYPELRVLDRHWYLPGIVLAIGCYAVAGWSGLVVGFVWGTILSHHATFANNCFAHVFGTRPFETEDLSRNNWFLALITLGEGWHNNHHRYPGSARNGFLWWEIDLTFYVLSLMKTLGLIWDLRSPPEELLAQRTAAAQVAR